MKSPPKITNSENRRGIGRFQLNTNSLNETLPNSSNRRGTAAPSNENHQHLHYQQQQQQQQQLLNQNLSSTQKSSWNKQGPPLYFLEDIGVKFGSIHALKSIHFTIYEGDKIYLTGASGAGKTTLLKVLAGLITPTYGKIEGVASSFKVQSPYYISSIFQDLKLISEWSCFDNLFLSYDPNLYRSKSEFTEEMYHLSKLFMISPFLKLKIKEANGGLKQKIAIIRSLLTKPKILLADEPTSALDRDNGLKLYEILNHYNQKFGLTIIWATHNQEFIKQFSGKMIQLNQGQLIYTGYSCFT